MKTVESLNQEIYLCIYIQSFSMTYNGKGSWTTLIRRGFPTACANPNETFRFLVCLWVWST